mgnify:CR=1 FL=1
MHKLTAFLLTGIADFIAAHGTDNILQVADFEGDKFLIVQWLAVLIGCRVVGGGAFGNLRVVFC